MKMELKSTECKELLVRMLKDFHNFCEENSLQYFVCYGTLLGAVRHKGFIPWDDDIDIVMPREDYELFLTQMQSRNSRYKVKSFKNDPLYPYCFAKYYDSNTVLKEHLWNDYEIGLYLDIVPFDLWPKKSLMILWEIKLIQKMIKVKAYRIGPEQSFIKNIILSVLKPLFYGINQNNLLCLSDDIVKKAKKSSDYIGNIAANWYGKREQLRKEWFQDCILMQFEDIKIFVPTGYDEILKRLYGNYMMPPPTEKQITHHTYTAHLK